MRIARFRRRAGPSLILLPLLLASCDAGEPEDGEARREGVPTPAPTPERIVSLVPAATSVLLAIGAGERLVARTDFDTADAVREIPSVGRGLHPDLERLLSLRPDLVVTFRGESDPRTTERLGEAGIEVLGVRPDRISDVIRMIRRLGRATGREGPADSLARSLEAELAAVRSRVRGRQPVPVAFLVGGSPPWAAGGDTFLDELLEEAGGVNVFDDLGRLYGPVSVEALVARDPAWILLPEGTPAPEGLDGPGLVRVPSWVTLPGPGLARSADTLARILHPEAFR